MATQANPLLTLEEYFELERKSVERHEYWNGKVYAMAGGTEAHSTISLNVGSELTMQLKERDCKAYNGNMRIRTSSSGLYTYTDVAVACHSRVERNTLMNPVVIVEVLSKRTEGYDRGVKFEQYRQIPTFQEYVLVAQDRVYVEHHVRQNTSHGRSVWLMTEYSEMDDSIYLSTIDVWLRLSEVYRKVSFPVRAEAHRKSQIVNRPSV